jgi:hypothetical protein
MLMEHRFAYPRVTEITTTRPFERRGDGTRTPASQRRLVEASLLRVPNKTKS